MYDAFVWNKRNIMVVDAMDVDLFTLRRDYRFDRFDACRQIAAGLAHIHACGIVHSDVKPENVLARFDESTSRWTMKLCDFGAASTVEGGDICDYGQTIAYRAPEMIVGDIRAIKPPADVWSYATIVFEIFTENVLFDPHESKHYSARSTDSCESSMRGNAEQLALIVELCGKVPKSFSKRHREYFNSKGHIKNIGPIKKIDLRVIMIMECNMEKDLAQDLYDFLQPLLMYTPHMRATAADCASHPFLARTDDAANTALTSSSSDSASADSLSVRSEDHGAGDEERNSAHEE